MALYGRLATTVVWKQLSSFLGLFFMKLDSRMQYIPYGCILQNSEREERE